MGDSKSIDYCLGILHDPGRRCAWASPPRTCRALQDLARDAGDQLALGQPTAPPPPSLGGLLQASRSFRSKSPRARHRAVVSGRRACARAATTLDVLGMKPAFKKDGGTVTAGNASGINDVLPPWCWPGDPRSRPGPQAPARLVGYAHAGEWTRSTWLLATVPATQKVLQRTGLKVWDMDVIETRRPSPPRPAPWCSLGLHPSSQPQRLLAFPLGHPVGATGAIITTKGDCRAAPHGSSLWMTMCIGGGEGIAAIFERV